MQSGHQLLSPGSYTVNNFQGEHEHPASTRFYPMTTVYQHDASTAVVAANSNGGIDIQFNLCPTQAGRPLIGSIYSEYHLTLHGVKVNSASIHNDLTVEMITVQNAKHDIKGLGTFIGDTLNGALTSEEIGSKSISIKITHQGSSNYRFDMVVTPSELKIKCEGLAGIAVSALNKVGLFSQTTITAHLQLDTNDNARPTNNLSCG